MPTYIATLDERSELKLDPEEFNPGSVKSYIRGLKHGGATKRIKIIEGDLAAQIEIIYKKTADVTTINKTLKEVYGVELLDSEE